MGTLISHRNQGGGESWQALGRHRLPADLVQVSPVSISSGILLETVDNVKQAPDDGAETMVKGSVGMRDGRRGVAVALPWALGKREG